jgi:thiol-disulfide isomerase/thioredoxin
MIRNRSGSGSILLLGWVIFLSASVFSQERPPDKILADIKSIKLPTPPANSNNGNALRVYAEELWKAQEARSDLIGELFKANPEHSDLASLLPSRWQFLLKNPGRIATLKAEANWVQARGKDEKLVNEAYFYMARSDMDFAAPNSGSEDVLARFEAFALRSPKDPRLPTMLFNYGQQLENLDAKEDIFKRIEKDYPNTTAAKQAASARPGLEGERRVFARLGKPFELEFTEASKGTPITMASLKGKVVVIDFWATWCGPCLVEMPNMKKLYAEFKDKGVEFIGVSLDLPKEKGGLDKLRDYVASNGIEWPQYYQGNYWQSEFSSSWEVHAIPRVFLVDADGNLASVKARGQLEALIPKYLEKAKSKGTAKTAATP